MPLPSATGTASGGLDDGLQRGLLALLLRYLYVWQPLHSIILGPAQQILRALIGDIGVIVGRHWGDMQKVFSDMATSLKRHCRHRRHWNEIRATLLTLGRH